jgi:LmbE family N-acetylglucosaminyl deacetylase
MSPETAGAAAEPTAERPSLRPSYDAVYLSPHLDDAVLSCGGQIRALTAAGKSVLVVTVAAADEPQPAERLSPLARSLHRAWKLDRPPRKKDAARGVVARRRAEDREACRILGAETLHWSFPEAIYRSDPDSGEPRFKRLGELFEPLTPGDRPSVHEVAELLAGLPVHRELYAPLGVGGHVDHRIVRRAAEQRFGSSLLYYEELPYARRRRDVRKVIRGASWRGRVVPVSPEALEAKVEAVAAYRSQVKPLFGGRLRMRYRVRRDVQRAGGERLWWWEVV